MDFGKPIFIGDHPALDFLNSVLAPHGEPIDSIGDGERYVAWLAAAGLLEASEAHDVRRRFPPAALDRVAGEARELREWFRQEIEKHAASRTRWPTPKAAAKLNELLASGTARAQLATAGEDWVLREEAEYARAPQLLVPIARAIADLAANVDWSLIRRCANPQCAAWFYDRTKAHTRIYCSAKLCGNRAKVAAFRERQRIASRRRA